MNNEKINRPVHEIITLSLKEISKNSNSSDIGTVMTFANLYGMGAKVPPRECDALVAAFLECQRAFKEAVPAIISAIEEIQKQKESELKKNKENEKKKLEQKRKGYIPLEDAEKAVDEIIKKVKESNVYGPKAISIIGIHRLPIIQKSMDGVSLESIDLSRKEAEKAMLSYPRESESGIAIVYDNRVVGAIGIYGRSQRNNHELALIGKKSLEYEGEKFYIFATK